MGTSFGPGVADAAGGGASSGGVTGNTGSTGRSPISWRTGSPAGWASAVTISPGD
ncbi:hypothetical protein ACWC0A_25975 [Streptomyces scopuliridis]